MLGNAGTVISSLIIGGVNAVALLFIGYFLRDVRDRIVRLEDMFMRPADTFTRRAGR